MWIGESISSRTPSKSMNDVQVIQPGASLESYIPPGLDYIRGIQIDNPSGTWIWIEAAKAWVPPYTINWGMTLPSAQQSITIRTGNGPAGKLGTTTGSAITVTLWNVSVPDSLGTTFIVKDTPEQAWGMIATNWMINPQTIIPNPGPTARIRLYAVEITYDWDQPLPLLGPGNSIVDYAQGYFATKDAGGNFTNSFRALLVISPAEPYAHKEFAPPTGISLGLDERLDVTVQSPDTNIQLRAMAYYSIE